MRRIAMFVIGCCLTNDLLRRSIRQSHRFCHAWTVTRTASGSPTSNRREVLRKNHRFGHFYYHLSDHYPSPRRQSHLYHSTWVGDMAPFSEFATHVKVSEEDAPTTVESAIFRSMTTLGSSSLYLSEDEKSYVEYNIKDGDTNTANDENSVKSLLIVKDSSDGIDSETDGNGNARIIAQQLKYHPPNSPMTPRQLLYLGGIWYLPADNYRKNEELRIQMEEEQVQAENSRNTKSNQRQRNRSSGAIIKPTRLSFSDATMTLHEGDYLRIHHTPRRFRQVYKVDWSFPGNKTTSNQRNNSEIDTVDCKLPVVIQQQGSGYCIIDKPPVIPVHATVDNAVENVAHQLYLALEQQQSKNITSFHRDQKQGDANITRSRLQDPHQKQHHIQEDPPYMAAVQRLDVNTSGLLVLATSPEFAAYFSQLLRHKTSSGTAAASNDNNNPTTTSTSSPTIEKGYKCLVCIQPDESSGESVLQAWKRLRNLQRPKSQHQSSMINANSTMIIRHYLKASDRAPKLFVERIPEDDEGNVDGSKWYECLMEITDVGEPIPLFASSNNNDDDETSNLDYRLWPNGGIGDSGNSRMPPTVKAVVEVQVSLITGRTHQIRGQLSKLGFPIVGDEQYGGAAPLSIPSEMKSTEHDPAVISQTEDPQLLALQCCHLSFRDAEYESVWNNKKKREVLRGRPRKSGRWVCATLENAWWTPFLEDQVAKEGTQFSDIDFRDADDDAPIKTEQYYDNNITCIDASTPSSIEQVIRPDMLPPAVQVTTGRNKYVVAKLLDPSTKNLRWFVQSAPMPYHAEVAFDLVEWIGSVPGYEQTRVEVTGGGRIDFDPSTSTVRVYGFSYRYGKGDHERVANMIESSTFGADLTVTFDLSDKLY